MSFTTLPADPPADPPAPAAPEPARRSGRRITTRQRTVLAAILRFFTAHGRFPTIRELGAEIGLRSTSTVHAHLRALQAHGLLRDDPYHIALAPTVMPSLIASLQEAYGGAHG
jgi:SOS-response transcriptional repressor LexA